MAVGRNKNSISFKNKINSMGYLYVKSVLIIRRILFFRLVLDYLVGNFTKFSLEIKIYLSFGNIDKIATKQMPLYMFECYNVSITWT